MTSLLATVGLVATGILATSTGTASAADPVQLTLLNINDFHGRITNAAADKDLTVALAGTIEEQRAAATAAGGDSLLLSAGDNIGASLFASSSAQDQPTIDVLNALGLAASAVGNHEFDRGESDLVDRVVSDKTNAKWDYLGANVYRKGTQTPALPEYGIYPVGGVRVGVIGAVTQETSTLVSPAGIADLDFGDPVAAVNRVAAQLTDGDESNGEADVLVAEYHEGAPAGDTTVPPATLDGQLAASPVFASIVNETSPRVAAIFTAHTHQTYAYQAPVPGEAGVTRPVVQTGSYGANVGKVVLTVDRQTGAVTATAATNVPRTTTAPADLVATYPRVAQVRSIVDTAVAAAEVIGRQPVGSVTADITTAFTGGSYSGGVYVGSAPGTTTGRDDRGSESTLGNLVADSLRASLSSADRGGAQIGVVNPGGLRADLLQAPDGVVTYAEANAVLPFVNNLTTVSLTGEQFRTLLEQQWQPSTASRPYLQLGLSDNVTYTFDPSAAAGSRITSVTVDGRPLDPAASYRIGTFSFLAAGGDNFAVFTQGTDPRDSGLIDRDAWIAYLQANPNLAPDFARRAVQVPAVTEPVTAGTQVTIPVAGLDLTSLGSPANTTVTASWRDQQVGQATVSGGRADVTVTVPADAPAGPTALVLTAQPSGTTVTVPFTVAAAPVKVASTTVLVSTAALQKCPFLPVLLISATGLADGQAAVGRVGFREGDRVFADVPAQRGLAVTVLPRLSRGEHVFTSAFTPADPSRVAGSTSNPVLVRGR
nr:bifunctional UDP-sugar hydrolase/5'-nucleotidase [Nakamurella flava]